MRRLRARTSPETSSGSSFFLDDDYNFSLAAAFLLVLSRAAAFIISELVLYCSRDAAFALLGLAL